MSLLCRPNNSPFRLQFHSCEHKTAIVFWTELEYLTAFSFKSSLTKFLFYFSAGKDVFISVKLTQHFQRKIRLTFGPGTPGSPRSPFPTGPASPLSPYSNRHIYHKILGSLQHTTNSAWPKKPNHQNKTFSSSSMTCNGLGNSPLSK